MNWAELCDLQHRWHPIGRMLVPWTFALFAPHLATAVVLRGGKANSQDDVWISAINASHPDSPGLLVTTAYWKIRSKRGEPEASDSVYRKCMMQVLSLNTPMVVYGDAQALTEMGEARRSSNVPPLVGQVQMKIDDLTPCSGHPEIWSHPQKYTNDGDVPSVQLGCIWDGKPSLLRQSAHEHPEYDWYAWLDVCMGHGDIPFRHGERLWPSSERLQTLPKDRITVSLSNEHMCETCRAGWTYCHCLAGTAFVVPKPLVDRLANKFSQKVDACLQSFSSSEDGAYICMSDQVIMTKLFLDEPDMFSIGSSGYGAVATQQLSSIPGILEYHASRDPVVGMRAALDPHRCDGHRDGVRGCRDCCGTNNFDDPCVDSCMKAD